MLNAIIRFSVRNKLIIGLCTLGLILWGSINLNRLPIDALPDITSNQVQVITVSPSLASPEVERLVTFPVEQANSNIPGVTEMRSISRFGLSVVTIVFADHTDIYWARQQVAERLNQVKDQIPASAGRPEMAPATTGLGEVFQYVVRPQKGYEGKYDLTELRSIQDWVIRRQLLGTPGVADVSSFGGKLKQYEVAVIPEKLKSLGVSLNDVFSALETNNQNSGGAYIEKGPNVLFIRTEGLAGSIEDIGNIVVRTLPNSIPVFIRDVATVRIGHAIRYGAMTFGTEGEVSGAVVLMLKGANASKVVNQVKKRVAQIKKTLPEGVEMEVFYDRTKMVNNAIGTVQKNLVEGALIVIFILVLFLGNLRAGLVVASVIPLSMLFAVIMMNLFGVSGNLMSLGALDFGLIVDGAVIIVEAVMHRLYHSKHFTLVNVISKETMNEEVESAAGKMMNSAVFGQIIILIVYFPILSLVGIEGKLFRPMAQTVSFALIGAFILSLTYVPMVTSLFLSRKMTHRQTWADRIMNFLQGLYQPALDRALRYGRWLVLGILVIFGFTAWLITRLGGEFIPELQEGDFAIDARILTGSSLTESINTTQRAVAILEKFPEVEKIVTRIGASEIPTDPMPVEMSDIIITLKPMNEWTSARQSDELANQMSEALKAVPGLTAGFQFPVQMRFNELISGARQDVVCKIFGDNLDSLAASAHRLGMLIGSVEGAKDIYVETVTGLPQIVVNYHREALARFGVPVSEVNRAVRMAFAGESAGMVYEQERRYDLVVRLEEGIRQDISDVRHLLITTPAGLQVPLYQLADVDIRLGPNQIQRENARRRIIVGFNVRGRDVQSVVEDLDGRVSRNLKLPPGYSITYGGQFENLVEARQRLSIAVPAALLLIFTMLYFAFGKLRFGVLIFSAIPLSAIGGILALWLRGMPFSISAGVGFIALFGVAVLNGIVLIAEFNRLKAEGIHDIKYVVMEGTKMRLRPVLMTASVASLGFLPMALSTGPGAEVQRPLATVVIGGLLSATFLTLMVLPILYTWFEKANEKPRRRRASKALLIIGLMISLPGFSQMGTPQRMKLDELLKMAADSNQQLRVLRQEPAYWDALQQHVFEPGKTQVGAEYGRINSLQTDTRFYVNQSVSLPAVYRRRRNLYQREGEASRFSVAWQELDLRRQVKHQFYLMADLMERRKLLNELDSLYRGFLKAADIRYQTGETNLLEKTAAEAQAGELMLQQQAAEADMAVAQRRLQWLLNSGDWILPGYDSLLLPPAVIDTSQWPEHPFIQYQQRQVAVMQAQRELERNNRSPEFTLGYNNQSITGWQSKDGMTQQFYGTGQRFSFYNLGIGVPLFTGASRARTAAWQAKERMASDQAEAMRIEWRNRLLQQSIRQQQELRSLRYYREQGLARADLILKQARLGYAGGENSYLEWIVMIREAVNLKLQYLEAARTYNETVIEIEYLIGK